MSKLLFFDTETTGVDERVHCIHQVAGAIEINGKVVEHFNIKMQPHPDAQIDDAALLISNLVRSDLDKFQTFREGFLQFRALLTKYVDPYDKTDKMFLVGYNNRSFDDKFLRMFFKLNKDDYFGSWFWSDSLDALVMASAFLRSRRHRMIDFKQGTVAEFLGIKVDKTRLHDAAYDTAILRQIFKKVDVNDFLS